MPFDVEAARKQNIPDDAIANRIIETRHLDGTKMRSQGLTDQQIIEHYSKLDAPPTSEKQVEPSVLKTAPSKFKEAATNVLHAMQGVPRAAAETAVQVGAAAVTTPIVGAATAVGSVAGPISGLAAGAATEMAIQAVAYDMFQVANNILEGRDWNSDLGKSTIVGAAGPAMSKVMGGIMGVSAKYLGSPEKAFTKIYGALKESTKGKFEKLKELPFFSDKEKDHIMGLVNTGKLSLLGNTLNDKVTYHSLINRGVTSEGHFEASQLAGESIKPKKLMEALDKAEARLDESTSPEGSAEAKEAIQNIRKKIEDNKSILSPSNVRGILDDLKDYMNKSKPKEGVPGNSKFQVFTGMDRAIDQDISSSNAKLLSMGSKLYHREKSLDNIFHAGFEEGKPMAGATGLRNFDSKKFLDAIDDPRVSDALDAGEKQELKELGTKLKGFELPTSGDFATIRTAKAALARHMAMGAVLGAGEGYREGGAQSAIPGAMIGILGAGVASRALMTGSIIRDAYALPEGKAIVDRELKNNAGKISAKTTLALANLWLDKRTKEAQKRVEEGKKFKRQRSQDIIDQTKQEIAGMNKPATPAAPAPVNPQPQGQPAPQAQQVPQGGMAGMLGQP